jgi:hypothetical protein
VIAAGDHLDAGGQQAFCDFRRDAEPGSGVFAVGDTQIDLPLREDVRQPVVNDLAPGRAYDVADEEDFQGRTFTGNGLLPHAGPLVAMLPSGSPSLPDGEETVHSAVRC